MTNDTKNPLPPRLDPTCTCICHTQPGVMHVAPCCREADPKDAEIARLRMALAETEALEMQHGAVIDRLRAERDAALAQVAGAYEAAAKIVADRYIKEAVSILTPADALAARRQALQEAADWLTSEAASQGGTKTPRGRTAQYYARKMRDLARIEAEQ